MAAGARILMAWGRAPVPIIRGAWSGGGMTMWHAMWNTKNAHSERGFAAFIVVAWLTLCLFVGMAVDIGILLRYRRAMQNACDSGVLDGARNLKPSPSTVVSDTKSLASFDMTQNNINWDSLSAQTLDGNGTVTGTNPVQDRANIHATVPTFFFKLVTPSVAVAIECTARLVPVSLTGLQPLGMNNQTFQNEWTNQSRTPCNLIGSTNPGPSGCTTDYQLTVGVSGSTWGSGNTGTLDLNNPICNGNGASDWSCVFQNGTGSNNYCIGPDVTNTSQWPACSIVNTKPGNMQGPVTQAVKAVCATPNPLTNPTTSKWIIILPLLNDQIWGSTSVNGRSQSIDIVGFAAFELDCPAMNNGNNIQTQGGTDILLGRFVSILDTKAVQGCFPVSASCPDTGVETVRLVE